MLANNIIVLNSIKWGLFIIHEPNKDFSSRFYENPRKKNPVRERGYCLTTHVVEYTNLIGETIM